MQSLAIFYNFETASGHKISLTGHHLIPINSLNNQINYTAAKQVQLGDQLYIHNNHNNQLEYSPVINITIELKTGYYAPLTMTGKSFTHLFSFFINKYILFYI